MFLGAVKETETIKTKLDQITFAEKQFLCSIMTVGTSLSMQYEKTK